MTDDPIRAAIQDWLDRDGEQWQVSHYAVVLGLERVRDGEFESLAWVHAPPDQPDWVTNGLIEKADEFQHAPINED